MINHVHESRGDYTDSYLSSPFFFSILVLAEAIFVLIYLPT